MINIIFNDEKLQVRAGMSLKELLDEKQYAAGCFAVAVNRNFIPRLSYADTFLNSEDQIDIIQPMQGG
jgi:sulfur carrier protein